MPADEFHPAKSPAAIGDRGYSWLNRFAWLTAVATLFLVCSGGMVTSKGVGLAVPDWPTSFGYNMFLFPISKWVGGIFFEHVHRLIASAVGLMTIILALWLWRTESRSWVRNLGWGALAAVVLQGVLGGLRVTLLKDEIGIFHACLAQAFFAFLVLIALVTSRSWVRLAEAPPPPPRMPGIVTLAIFVTGIIYLQLALGATMRHEHRDLAILDFPLAYGKWLPVFSAEELGRINAARDAQALSNVTPFHIWLQMAHRFVAVVIGLGIIRLWVKTRNFPVTIHFLAQLVSVWVFLLFCQITLGAWTIWSNKAADVATAHVALGATMFGLGVAISALALRMKSSARDLPLIDRSPTQQRIAVS